MKLYDISQWCKLGAEIEDYPYIGEIEINNYEFGDVIEIAGEHYCCSIRRVDNSAAGVRKISLGEAEDRDYENNLTCPYCGYKDMDSWELSDDEDEHECGRCGGVMSFQRIVTVEYSSQPIKPPNIVNAKWRG